jgi:phosphoribosylformylglycinamidine synthase
MRARGVESSLDATDPGLHARLTFELPNERRSAARAGRPKVAVLREQGVNGQREMAATLDRAGFEAHDVHMSDILSGRAGLDGYRGVVACGGFSYGDVLGAGEGWAKTILYHERARAMFAEFFARADAFALGVCNGCQMLAALRELIPGTELWPQFCATARINSRRASRSSRSSRARRSCCADGGIASADRRVTRRRALRIASNGRCGVRRR